MDKELSRELEKKIKENGNDKETFPEHEFLASCLRIGLQISDLRHLTYVDVMKTLLSFVEETKKDKKEATQKDIDKLLG